MGSWKYSKLISLACTLTFAPVSAVFAAPPTVQEESTPDGSGWLAAVSSSRIARNGTSLEGTSTERRRLAGNGTSLDGRERRERIVRNGTSLDGRERRERVARNGTSLDGRERRERVVRNGTSLDGRSPERRRRIAKNGTSLSGRSIRSEGGMTIVSLELPGAARHAK